MVIAKEPIRCKLVVDDPTINQVSKFNSLGVNISGNRNLSDEARVQANKAARISGYLRDIIWRNKFMSTESKDSTNKTCVRPVLAYSRKTSAETSKTKTILRTTEMKVLSIRGVTLRDRMRNNDTREELGVQDIVRWEDQEGVIGNTMLKQWTTIE
ncbi:uncharacterized protein LOC115885833 [Sitophilus oryzae]|uniref:Uncharacterized protein LOC115885833 n=1 Tax=Sitophilus oryzae TaxID=7048 RepID=A0A6J2YC00_SITOR|nr:uncharacterized protein LOC115885833 [Sitophilus oryzae]